MSAQDSEVGCAAIEDRILDAVVDGLDAATARHLESCPACVRLAAQYLETAGIARRALSTRARRRTMLHRTATAAAAAIVLAIGFFALDRRATGEFAAPPLTALEEADAVIEHTSKYHAAIRAGASTFVLTDPASVVDTPFGSLSCPTGCEFRVSIQADECGLALPAGIPGSIRLAIEVASGNVVSHLNGRSDILAASHRLTLPLDHYR